MKYSLLRHLIVKYIPLILGLLVLSFGFLDLLIDKYIPDNYIGVAWVSTMAFYCLISIVFGVLLKKLFQILLTDSLTGLYTRRYFYPMFSEEMLKINENKTSISLLMIDTDKFKTINDTFGHLAGDYILKQLSNIFKQSLRASDTIVRWGGEEFLILLPHIDSEEANIIAERIRSTVEGTKFYYEDNCISVTLSIGVATTNHYYNARKFVDLADQMLYKAKEKRNIIKSIDCSYTVL